MLREKELGVISDAQLIPLLNLHPHAQYFHDTCFVSFHGVRRQMRVFIFASKYEAHPLIAFVFIPYYSSANFSFITFISDAHTKHNFFVIPDDNEHHKTKGLSFGCTGTHVKEGPKSLVLSLLILQGVSIYAMVREPRACNPRYLSLHAGLEKDTFGMTLFAISR